MHNFMISANSAARNVLASFPGSPLALTKNRKGGGEPGIDSHVPDTAART